jgi:hypothetical protein
MLRFRPASVLVRPGPWAVLWLACFIAARSALEVESLAVAVRIAIALAPVPLGAIVLRLLVRAARALDELERRIQLEALATAFVLAVILLMTIGLLQRVITLEFEDWSYLHVWGMLPLLYATGLVLARRRYHEEPPQG